MASTTALVQTFFPEALVDQLLTFGAPPGLPQKNTFIHFDEAGSPTDGGKMNARRSCPGVVTTLPSVRTTRLRQESMEEQQGQQQQEAFRAESDAPEAGSEILGGDSAASGADSEASRAGSKIQEAGSEIPGQVPDAQGAGFELHREPEVNYYRHDGSSVMASTATLSDTTRPDQVAGKITKFGSPRGLPQKNTFIHFDEPDSPIDSDRMVARQSCPGTVQTLPSLRTTRLRQKRMEHLRGECVPCAFFAFKDDGCRMGDDCEFCHLCDRKEIKKKRKMKAKALKEQTLAGGV